MKQLWLLLPLTLILYSQNLSAAQAPKGKVIKYGVFKVVEAGRIKNDPSTTTGKIISRPKIELVKQTHRIPLQKDTYFAYQYRLTLPDDKLRVKLKRVVIHPEMTMPNGTRSSGSTRIIKERVSNGEVFALDGYAFNEKYEMVEGDWTFQIWYRDQMLVEQKFTAYWPAQPETGLSSKTISTEKSI